MGHVVINLNYKHLRYFWMVAKMGSIARASEQLYLSPQSISGQLGKLEAQLGVQLFSKVGRGLELTEMGNKIYSYADDIFAIGYELIELTQNQTLVKSPKFRIGITDTVIKSIAYKVIEPVLFLDESMQLICKEGKLSNLLEQLFINTLDLVITDRPMRPILNVSAYNHLLGESKLAIFGSQQLLNHYQGLAFPALLNKAPFLMQGDDFMFRTKLNLWFEANRVYPRIVAEFDDSAMLESFGQSGAGFFAAPLVIAKYICDHYQVEKVGHIDTITEQIYAITTERRLTHPAIVAILKSTANIFAA